MVVNYATNYKGLNAIVFDDGTTKYLSDKDVNDLFSQLERKR